MKSCVAITSYLGQNVKHYFWKKKKKVASFLVANRTVKVKLLNIQVCSITHEVDLSALTHEGPLVGTDRNE